MGPEIRVRQEEAVEAHIIYASWSAGVEINGVEYVFLRGEDESAGSERAGSERGCRCGFVSELVVRRGEERDLVDDGINKVGRYGWERHDFRAFVETRSGLLAIESVYQAHRQFISKNNVHNATIIIQYSMS